MSRKNALAPLAADKPVYTETDYDAAIAALEGLLDLEERAPVSEVTLALAPEENRRILANAFALDGDRPARNTDDEMTLDARSPLAPFVARITTRPPPLEKLVLTSMPPRREPSPTASVADAPRFRPSVKPVIAKAPQDPQLLVVAGIWAMALSLMATLAVIVMA